jgi:hypothetical protein
MKSTARWLLVTMLGMGGVGCVFGEEVGGTLELFKAGEASADCTITIKPGIHSYYMGDDCTNDDLYDFRLKDAKSAVFILFGSEDLNRKCPAQKDDGWQQEIKTIKNNLTMDDSKNIGKLSGETIGKVYTPGIVRTWERNTGGVDYNGTLSCVTIFWCPASAGVQECHDKDHVIGHEKPPQ